MFCYNGSSNWSIVSCLSFLSPYGSSPLTVFSSFFTLFITTNPTNNTTITPTIISNLFLIYYKASSLPLQYLLFYMNLEILQFNSYIKYKSRYKEQIYSGEKGNRNETRINYIVYITPNISTEACTISHKRRFLYSIVIN